MKATLSTIVTLAIFITNAAAAPEPLPTDLDIFETEDGIKFHGEPLCSRVTYQSQRMLTDKRIR